MGLPPERRTAGQAPSLRSQAASTRRRRPPDQPHRSRETTLEEGRSHTGDAGTDVQTAGPFQNPIQDADTHRGSHWSGDIEAW